MNMMQTGDQHHRTILQDIAHRVMIERGLLPDFSHEALAELENIQSPVLSSKDETVRDLT